MTNYKRYKLVAFTESDEMDNYMLHLERSGEVIEASIPRTQMRQDDLDVLLETGTQLCANLYDGRIMEFFIL